MNQYAFARRVLTFPDYAVILKKMGAVDAYFQLSA
jgi:hypothetical protein